MHDRVPLSRDSLSTKAYQRLRRDLMEGRFQPGQKLKLRDLARELGTSPTPVREALARLVSDMALTQIDHHSVSVPPMSARRYLEIRDLRIELEGRAAASAALRATKAEVAELASINERLVAMRHEKRWFDALVENQHFHLTLCELAGMPVLFRMVESLWMQIGPMQNALLHNQLQRRPQPHPHLVILDGLTKSDPRLARHGVEQDLILFSEPVLRYLEGEVARERSVSRKPPAQGAGAVVSVERPRAALQARRSRART